MLLNMETECWDWPGGRTNGYGYLTQKAKTTYAHRWMWEVANGPIPPGLFVCHHCDNRACFRPDHLFLGSAGDNNRDMAAKGRHGRYNLFKTHCPKGHPYDEANTRINKKGWRCCRACQREWSREQARRRRGG